MTLPSIDAQMLSTLEMLHYCRRFQDTLFAFSFRDSSQCHAVLLDLRVLVSARIRQVVFCAADENLTRTIDSWRRSGDRFAVIEASVADLESPLLLNRIRALIAAGDAPFIAISDLPSVASEDLKIREIIVSRAVQLGVKKIFFAGDEFGLEINGKFRSYPSAEEIHQSIAQGASLNLSVDLLNFFVEQQELHNVDIVMVQARRGAIYEEVFTHAGSGTLFSREYKNILRVATESDVRDIMAIMQPYIVEGALKLMTEDELLSIVDQFMVYAVNDQIIAAAALIQFGSACELAKLCTLPRFQARGRAKDLVRALIERARTQGSEYVFALTVSSYVCDFFERLGFYQISRESLPQSWKIGYDLSRQSKAFRFDLNK